MSVQGAVPVSQTAVFDTGAEFSQSVPRLLGRSCRKIPISKSTSPMTASRAGLDPLLRSTQDIQRAWDCALSSRSPYRDLPPKSANLRSPKAYSHPAVEVFRAPERQGNIVRVLGGVGASSRCAASRPTFGAKQRRHGGTVSISLMRLQQECLLASSPLAQAEAKASRRRLSRAPVSGRKPRANHVRGWHRLNHPSPRPCVSRPR